MELKFEKYKKRGLTGLGNLGNTCFMNSALQCLSHCYELSEFLEKGEYKNILNKKPDSLILLEWDKLRTMMWSENCVISPGGFVTSIQKVAKLKDKEIFTGYAQNDLTEFIIFLIDCFHTAILREVEMTIKGKVITNKDKLAEKCFEMMKMMYRKEYSEFLNMFYGIHVSSICKMDGDAVSIKPEPFFMLHLPIPEKRIPSIYDCFVEYTKNEKMEGDNMYYNEDEDRKHEAIKRFEFWNLPQILIIVLKRFSNNIKKNQKKVTFPLADLDLSKFVIGYNNLSYKYDLFGVCNHGGSVFGGHYTAFVKNANNKWYHFNDTIISEVGDSNKIVSNKAYCFFYRKKKIS